jgi:hypothetical protein
MKEIDIVDVIELVFATGLIILSIIGIVAIFDYLLGLV